ncbi:MAG: maleylacetoacetate isomerase [Beijerinckiaceae bacterium]
MQFYGYFRSSAAYRCRIAFNLKGVAPETVFVHLRKGEQLQADFLAKNPHGLVPALEADGHLLTQSLAIIEWLDETQAGPRFLPDNAFDRAYVRSLALSIACDIHPLQNLRVLNHVRDAYGQDQAGMFAWGRHFVSLGLNGLEAQINASGKAGKFCFGDTPTLADICLVPQMFSARRFSVDTSQLTTLNRIHAHCETLPAFQAAHPERQPDFEA